MDDTYGHTPVDRMFTGGDVYGVGYDDERAARPPLRLAVIGAGGVAQSKYFPAITRLRTLWEPVEITAFAEPREDHGRKLQAIYGSRWYADYQALLAGEEVDGVLVLSPDALHAEHSIACLEAGRPVLVEKPVARSLAAAERMCRVADERGLTLMCVANKRCSPPYRRARHLLDHGALPDPALFAGKFNLGYEYVDLLESGTIHLFDLARFLMGDVAEVSALGVNRYAHSRGYPIDNAIIACAFASGALGSLHTSCSALSLKPWERVEVYGDHVWLAVEDQWTLTLYDDERGPAKSWSPAPPNTLLFDEEWGGYMALVENFLQVIRGVARPVVTGWDGYRAYELNVASHLSMARKAPVVLPLDASAADDEAAAWLERAAGGTR